MSIDHTTVKRIAHLARIEVAEDDLSHFATELSALLDWVEVLKAVDTSDVEPLTSVVEADLPRRPDSVTDGDCRAAVLANAPYAEHGFFAVPKVIE